jgi:hypothetical protein
MQVKWSELLLAFEAANIGPMPFGVYIERESGKILFDFKGFDAGDADEDKSGDVIHADEVDPLRHLEVPSRYDLALGKPLVLDFAAKFMPDRYDDIADMFRRRRAYSRFKALLADCGALEQWHSFEAEAEAKALREWAADNDIEILD